MKNDFVYLPHLMITVLF